MCVNFNAYNSKVVVVFRIDIVLQPVMNLTVRIRAFLEADSFSRFHYPRRSSNFSLVGSTTA